MMESEKQEAIQELIAIFAKDFSIHNCLLLVDMSTGSYRIDQMLYQEIKDRPRKPDTNG